MHQNYTNSSKHEFGVQWGGSGVYIAKNSDATSWHELLHQFGPFCTEFRKATKRSQMHQNCTNAPKHEFRVQWGGSGAFIAKNSDVTSWHELLHQFGPFCTVFRKATKRSQMHQNCTNTPKHESRVQWGGSGAFVAKNSTRLRGTNFCISSARFAPSFVRQPNGPECTQMA